jgi:hypothetical protein
VPDSNSLAQLRERDNGSLIALNRPLPWSRISQRSTSMRFTSHYILIPQPAIGLTYIKALFAKRGFSVEAV